MDDKFRLVFSWSGATPTAKAYVAPEVSAYDTLREAITAAREVPDSDYAAFIAHKYIVFEPLMIRVLYEQLFAEGATV